LELLVKGFFKKVLELFEKTPAVVFLDLSNVGSTLAALVILYSSY
jgi:hypothetical protein